MFQGEANSLAQKIQSKPDNVEETKGKTEVVKYLTRSGRRKTTCCKKHFEYLNELSGETYFQNQIK